MKTEEATSSVKEYVHRKNIHHPSPSSPTTEQLCTQTSPKSSKLGLYESFYSKDSCFFLTHGSPIAKLANIFRIKLFQVRMKQLHISVGGEHNSLELSLMEVQCDMANRKDTRDPYRLHNSLEEATLRVPFNSKTLLGSQRTSMSIFTCLSLLNR